MDLERRWYCCTGCTDALNLGCSRSEEEKCELEDEEGEQLHFLMEPILKDLKDYKRLGEHRFEVALLILA